MYPSTTIDAAEPPMATGPAHMKCLCIYGSDRGYSFRDGVLHPRAHGTSALHHQIDRDRIDVTQILLCPLKEGQVLDLRLGPFDVIVNTIADVDVNPETLAMAETICDRSGLPVINHPASIRATTREQMYDLLKDVPDILIPPTIRLQGKSREQFLQDFANLDFNWPALWRPTGSHTGTGLELFETKEQAITWIASHFENPDDPVGDHYLTEFVDFASPDGLYRKLRIYCIGDTLFFRHQMVGERWNLHATSRIDKEEGNEDLLNEGWTLFQSFEEALGPRIYNALATLNRRTGLDFVGTDAAIMQDGRVLIFEANPNMELRAAEPVIAVAKLNEATRQPIRQKLNEIILATS